MKLETGKDAVSQSSEKLRFRTPFHSQQFKGSETLRESAPQHFYNSTFFSSLCRKLSWKICLLVICEISVLLVNTLVADDKYSFCNGEYHPRPIEMQLSKKQKTFSEVFLKVWSLRQILNISKKKMTLIADVFRKLESAKNVVS